MARKTRRTAQRDRKNFAEKITFNPPRPRPRGRKPPLAEEGVLTDEDRTGKFMRLFGGIGQHPISKE
jgi:hypothetical protein